MSLTVNLDGEALREATARAIEEALTPDVKKQLIRDSITKILEPSCSLDGRQSIIAIAFQNAVRELVFRETADIVSKDPKIQESIKQLVRTTGEKIVNCDSAKFTDRWAAALIDSFRRE